MAILRADAKRHLREHDMARLRLYEASRLFAIGVNAPKRLPKFKATADQAPARLEPDNSEWARAQVSAFFLGFKAQAKANGDARKGRG